MARAALSGSQAVARLERRGGQVWVFRYGYGSAAKYTCAGREDGATVITGPIPTHNEPGCQHRRWVLTTDLERDSLAHDMEAARTRLSASAGDGYELLHRDVLDTDAGYAQVGCVLALLRP